MSLAWPAALVALLAGPLVLGVAWLVRRRRRRAAVRVTSVAIVRAAVPGRSAWRRRVPPALLVAGLTVLGVGAARPQVSRAVTSSSTTILLAMDVSGSMCQTDVDPNRLTVAQRAATEFIESQAGRARIGLVTFASFAALLVPPTDDTDALLDAIADVTTSRGTAIGQAILTSIDAIAEIDPSVAPSGADTEAARLAAEAGNSEYAPEVIVVLTDGANTEGIAPEVAAQAAADRRVRVYTIGFGTTNPSAMVCSASQMGGSSGPFGGGGGFPGGGGVPGGGGGFPGGGGPGGFLEIDEPSLSAVADTTGGDYFRAENADQLRDALGELPEVVSTTRRNVDVAAWLAGAGGVLVVAAVGLALWWNRPRPAPRAAT